MDVNIWWNSTLELLEQAYQWQEFTCKWLKNTKYSDYWPLFTTQDEWTMVKYVLEVIRPFRYWTLWMTKWHTVTLHHVISVYNDMFDHMDDMMRALAKKKKQWKEDFNIAMKFTRQKLSKYYSEGTSMTGMLLILAHILDPFQKLRLCRKWDNGLDINPEDETSYITEYQEPFLKYVPNKNCVEHRRLPVTTPKSLPNNNLVSSPMASRSGQSSYDPYDLSSDDEEYLMRTNVVETSPGRNNCEACLMTAARLYSIIRPELLQNSGQINRNLNHYQSDPMVISSTFWLLGIGDWWRQEEVSHSKYADLSNVAPNICSIIPQCVGVEARFSLWRDVIGWRQSKTTGGTPCEKVEVRQFARANTGVLAGDDQVLDTTSTGNDMEMKRAEEQRKFPRMAKVHHLLEMW